MTGHGSDLSLLWLVTSHLNSDLVTSHLNSKTIREKLMTKARKQRRAAKPAAGIAAASLLAIVASGAEARVTKIVVENKVSPAFDGATFGTAGQYETLTGRAYGELDP